MEEDVARLPKNAPAEHSSANGALMRYQEKLAAKYTAEMGNFDRLVRGISGDCKRDLAQRMATYGAESDELRGRQNQILSLMATATVSLEELKQNLQEVGESLTTLTEHVHEDMLAIYSASFAKLRPAVDATFESVALYRAQLPEQFQDKLPSEVKRLNRQHLETKQELIKSMYSLGAAVKTRNEEIDNAFTQLRDEWKESRIVKLNEEAREAFDPFASLNLGPLFEEFRQVQCNFTHCTKKLLSDLVLFAPPEHFTSEDLERWWKEVQEVLESHGNFVTQFLGKFQARIDERNQKNAELLTSIEVEMNELKSEAEAAQALAEIAGCQKQAQKVFIAIMDKLERYWGARRENLRKAFTGIYEFMRTLIEAYQKFVTGVEENREFVNGDIKEMREKSAKMVEEIDAKIEQKSNEILLLVSDKEIQARVNDCKALLADIEKEYRGDFSSVVAMYETQPALVAGLFETCERAVLGELKLRKTANGTDVVETPRLMTGASERSKKKLAVRQQKRPVKSRMDTSGGSPSAYAFSIETGAKFEETEPTTLIPTFDDFVDDNPPVTPTRGGRTSNARGKAPPPPARGKKPARPAPRGRAGRGKIEEPVESEMPDFSLLDFVPKNDGVVSVWIYIPVNDDVVEWFNSFRIQLVTAVHNRYATEMVRASYAAEREELIEELNERMRMHLPRTSAVELSVAQARKLQIESRHVQLEKHFTKAVAAFNKGLISLDNSMESRKKSLADGCAKLRSFIDDLSAQKVSSSFAVQNQNFKIGDKQFLAVLEKAKVEEDAQIRSFLDGFKTNNDRFLQRVVMDDDSYSAEEKESAKQYFERMNSQIEGIVKSLGDKQKANGAEIDKLHEAIVDDYNLALPCHKADVQFSESLLQVQKDSRGKWSLLQARSRQQEVEIDRLLACDFNVQDAPACEGETSIRTILETLDRARVAIIQRGHFLGLLKARLTPEPMTFALNFRDEQPTEKKTEMEDTGGGRNKRGKGRQPAKPAAAKGKQVQQQPSTGIAKIATFAGGADQATSDISAEVAKITAEYYTTLKTRKIGNTRPDLIPAQQQECVEKMMNEWKKHSENRGEILAEASLRYRAQVQTAATWARDCQRTICDIYGSFYADMAGRERADAQSTFDAEMRELVKIRSANKDRMVPRLADLNCSDEFMKLLEEEDARSKREKSVVCTFNDAIIDCEEKVVKMYTSHLPSLMMTALRMFDKFILLDDLKGGPTVQIERKTMKELRKEKERQATAANDQDGRPFHTREWPSLAVIMSPLTTAVRLSQPVRESSPVVQKGRGSSKRTASSKKEVDKSDAAPDPMATITSLDTALSRGLIVERNRGYEEYEQSLAKRLGDFQAYVDSLNAERDAFSSYWDSLSSSLRPDVAFHPVAPPRSSRSSRKKSKEGKR